MSILQWFTAAFTGFLCFLAFLSWVGWSKPGQGTDHRKEILAALMTIESLLIGVFLQEFRIQDKAQQVTEARQVAMTYSAGRAQLQNLTARVSPKTGTTRDSLRRSQSALDSIRTALDAWSTFDNTMAAWERPKRQIF